MLLSVSALIVGAIILALSADKFVEGAAITSQRLGIPPLLVGILVIGFGSSMPEFVVSVLAAADGKTGLALGNALGSNITNIALILGLTAVITPITVKSSVLGRELPILVLVTIATASLFYVDGMLDERDGWLLIFLFLILMTWSIYTGMGSARDELAADVVDFYGPGLSMQRALAYLVFGLIFLILSSRLLVWGGVGLAESLGVSDLVIGLTIVALGTSLPELAASIAAIKRNEHDLALGNVIGSNLFNTSIVIGIAGVIGPTRIDAEILSRDLPVVLLTTTLLFIMCYNFRNRAPRINRLEAGVLLFVYVGYYMVVFAQSAMS